MKRTALLVVLNLVLLATSSAVASAGHATSAELVLISATDAPTAKAAATETGAQVIEVLPKVGVLIAMATPRQAGLLRGLPGIAGVYPPNPWHFALDSALRATGMQALRQDESLTTLRRPDGTAYDGSGVSIAVIDTGIDADHEMFVEDGRSKVDVQLRQQCEALPPPDGDVVCGPWVPGAGDEHVLVHGTHVASIAAGYERTTPSGRKVSGVATGARLVELGLNDPAGVWPLGAQAVSALNWVLEHHHDPCGNGSCPPIRVVNLSAGCCFGDEADPDWPEIRLATALADEGVVVVWAAGNVPGSLGPNDGSKTTLSAVADNQTPGVISVANYYDGEVGDRELGVYYTSARGRRGEPATYPDLAAPGSLVFAACPVSVCTTGVATLDPGYAKLTGTSMAAPHVAGLAAVVLEANPTLTAGEVEDILEDSAHKFGDPSEYIHDPSNPNDQTSYRAGHGLVDAVGAVSLALQRGTRTAPSACSQVQATSLAIADGAESTPVAAHYDISRIDASWPAGDEIMVDVHFADLASTPPPGIPGTVNLELQVDGEHIEVFYEPGVIDQGTTTVWSGTWAPGTVASATTTYDDENDVVRFSIKLANDLASWERIGGLGAWAGGPVLDFVYGACTVWRYSAIPSIASGASV